ncbi:unnamed protein product [Colletotrichum noveboracense]|uniref:Uncharacterized protein n=1 Tax=Colletotrichum noveboracense TaxID=2664923 RepID=A0A9W4RRC4_9PEZI|nr:unnamed protein product [Colletotrichum noveboracense]
MPQCRFPRSLETLSFLSLASKNLATRIGPCSRYAQILLHFAAPGLDFKDITTKAIKSPSTMHIVLVSNISNYHWTWSENEVGPGIQTTTCPVGFDTLEALPNVLLSAHQAQATCRSKTPSAASP